VRSLRSFGSVNAFADTLKAVDMFHGQHASDRMENRHTGEIEPTLSGQIEVVDLVRLFELALAAKLGFQHQYNTGHYTGRRE
jgi:hypothetical protein